MRPRHPAIHFSMANLQEGDGGGVGRREARRMPSYSTTRTPLLANTTATLPTKATVRSNNGVVKACRRDAEPHANRVGESSTNADAVGPRRVENPSRANLVR